MKKHLLAILIATACLGVTAKSQVQRGYYLIGGDLADISVGFSEGTPITLRLTTKFAWFQTDNNAVGGFVDLGLSTAKGEGTIFTYGIGPLARYYFGAADV